MAEPAKKPVFAVEVPLPSEKVISTAELAGAAARAGQTERKHAPAMNITITHGN